MSPRVITLLFISLILVLIAIADTTWALDSIRGNTISELALGWTRSRPIAGVCFGMALGILLGHLFWPQFLPKP